MRKEILIIWMLLLMITSLGVAQNAPITTAGTVTSNSPEISVPITVKNFTSMGTFKLKLTYNTAIVGVNAVVPHASLSGSFLSNTLTPGVILVQWYSQTLGTTLPENAVMFTVKFAKVATGTSDLVWVDSGSSCKWTNSSNTTLTDVPTSTYYINGLLTIPNAPVTIFPNLVGSVGSILSVPVTVRDFKNIGAFSLSAIYDPAVLSYQSFVNNSGFPGLTANVATPGYLQVLGTSMSGGQSLPEDAVLFSLNFLYNGGSTALTWSDNGESCEYTDALFEPLNDNPTGSFYLNGSVQGTMQLQLKLFLEGLYNATSRQMNKAQDYVGGVLVDKYPGTVADKISVELHDGANYQSIVYVVPDVSLNQDGTAILNIPGQYNGSYYIVVKHRNHIATVSANPVNFNLLQQSWSFSESLVSAYGSNMKLLSTGDCVLFTGDVNQDDFVNGLDLSIVNSAFLSLQQGYVNPDINGDGSVNGSDLSAVNSAFLSIVQSIFP